MNAVVEFQAPRLPYHNVIEERFGIDRMAWRALTEAVFPAAESVDSVLLAVSYCRARNLDIFKRPVQIVPIWDKKRGKMVETVWPGISELRTTAMRTGNYAGKEKTVFGPLITETLGGVEVTFPEYAQTTLLRVVKGVGVCRFEGPEVYWLETYATAKKDTAAPNAMWKKRPRGQLDKCAEAAALRAAFPEEIGNEYAAEEIEGQTFGRDRETTPVASGVRERLEQHGQGGGGFSPTIVEEGMAESRPLEPEAIDAILDGDDIPDFDAQTGEVIEPADGFPGDQPARTEAEPNKPASEGSPLTMAQRVTAFEKRVDAAPGTAKLNSLWLASAPFRSDLEAEDPAEAARVEQYWNDARAAADAKEKAGE